MSKNTFIHRLRHLHVNVNQPRRKRYINVDKMFACYLDVSAAPFLRYIKALVKNRRV